MLVYSSNSNSNGESIFKLSTPEQLNRWPWHSLTDWLTHSWHSKSDPGDLWSLINILTIFYNFENFGRLWQFWKFWQSRQLWQFVTICRNRKTTKSSAVQNRSGQGAPKESLEIYESFWQFITVLNSLGDFDNFYNFWHCWQFLVNFDYFDNFWQYLKKKKFTVWLFSLYFHVKIHLDHIWDPKLTKMFQKSVFLVVHVQNH